jgi:hypothetical protein
MFQVFGRIGSFFIPIKYLPTPYKLAVYDDGVIKCEIPVAKKIKHPKPIDPPIRSRFPPLGIKIA